MKRHEIVKLSMTWSTWESPHHCPREESIDLPERQPLNIRRRLGFVGMVHPLDSYTPSPSPPPPPPTPFSKEPESARRATSAGRASQRFANASRKRPVCRGPKRARKRQRPEPSLVKSAGRRAAEEGQRQGQGQGLGLSLGRPGPESGTGGGRQREGEGLSERGAEEGAEQREERGERGAAAEDERGERGRGGASENKTEEGQVRGKRVSPQPLLHCTREALVPTDREEAGGGGGEPYS
ncbi:hypothetical protein Mp_3g19490 [Marchantia polymorpha subsp. ruderalis]|uniref:Uncharacterized protein n=2 Tax=Marchantia polymorpha TaxID=3197 RepID=A0AAF6B2K2_MARPO|nr:hypothetical protein MARPO_0049s0085 [Marchantia polymorpha]BBN06236.1 hypothetical protein Mp_3g19490 [Marchantia polymorpha subsp. ruderalis]|eukprot:PTQ38806.1 hypothetical protein MARPO_0049s0085 [Marchantia polymorpha]